MLALSRLSIVQYTSVAYAINASGPALCNHKRILGRDGGMVDTLDSKSGVH
jgi:hypothetical protein